MPRDEARLSIREGVLAYHNHRLRNAMISVRIVGVS